MTLASNRTAMFETRDRLREELNAAHAAPLDSWRGGHMDPVEVAVDVDLEQHSRLVGRATRLRGFGALEAKLQQVQLVDKDVDHPHGVVLIDEVVAALGQ